MSVLLLVTTSLYAGFQWTIRALVYPQFAAVPVDAFVAFESRHQRLVSIVVGPLFVAEGASSIAAFALRPGAASVLVGACLAGVLALTAFAAVPAHRVLSGGFDPVAYRRLLAVDSARLLLALGAVAGAAWYAAG